MSSAKRIVQDLSELLISVDKLLQTETAKQAPAIATELGAETQLNEAIDFLQGLLEQIKTALATMRDPLSHVEALSGLVWLLEPFMNAVTELTDLSGQQLEKMGMGEATDITGPLSDAVEMGGKVMQAGQQALDDLPSVDDLDILLNDLEELAKNLLNYKTTRVREAVVA